MISDHQLTGPFMSMLMKYPLKCNQSISVQYIASLDQLDARHCLQDSVS